MEKFPDNILLLIFSYLSPYDVISAGAACKILWKVSLDNFLWKDLFHAYFKVRPYSPLPKNAKSWYQEFVRLIYQRPRYEAVCLKDHKDQVLHVSYSHDGNHFASCSKDGFVKVWDSSAFPIKLKYSNDLKAFNWKYTQYSQFNAEDSLLLVSGVHFGIQSTSGEIAVFDIMNDFQLQCRVINRPYDIFGTWYNNEYLISGNLHWMGHLISCSALWINKAWQEVDSENEAVVMQTFKFFNLNGSSMRTIMVADCLIQETNLAEQQKPPNTTIKPYSSSDSGSSLGSGSILSQPYRANNVQLPSTPSSTSLNSSSDVASTSSSARPRNNVIEKKEKYLIFTTGSRTYTPHQIGFKKIKPIRMAPPQETLNYYRGARLFASNQAQNFPEQVEFDDVDHLIDVNGHIIGMNFSPDSRYLYVNVRAWPQDALISNPLHPPPIAQEIEIIVIDMLTLQRVEGQKFRAHKAFTPNEECFFIFLDVSDAYVASGAEDKHAYLWDRHYGVLLDKFPHNDVVNSVAFNPKNPEMMVSTSDDNSVKVWVSKRLRNKYLLNEKSE